MDQRLLEKYWNAETTPEEEQRLLDEMASTQGPEANYFAMIAHARRQKSRLTMEDIKSRIAVEDTPVTIHRTISSRRWIMRVAAVLIFAVALGSLWYYTKQSTQPDRVMAETFDDPYEAYAEVREALAYVSAKMNKSQSEALVQIKKAEVYADMFK